MNRINNCNLQLIFKVGNIFYTFDLALLPIPSADIYLPVNSGFLFSRKAATPSL